MVRILVINQIVNQKIRNCWVARVELEFINSFMYNIRSKSDERLHIWGEMSIPSNYVSLTTLQSGNPYRTNSSDASPHPAAADSKIGG